MKLKPLSLAVLQLVCYPAFAQSTLGVPTAVFSSDPTVWLNKETVNKANETINANFAWSRGWTGKGSTILIMDTGIDVNHPDFAGKIKYQFDISKTGLQDKIGHGTHTAGIAAAALNGVGITGVAFDANLAIAKLSNTSSVTSGQALQALNWARQYSDINVANFSANTSYSAVYTKSVTQVAPGIYSSNDKNYGGANYYNLENPRTWAAALSPNTVLTVSAGNSSLPYPQNPATFASATDNSGKLLLNGQMLVVGNWNAQAGRVEGAKAGHVCKNLVGTTCNDAYRTSDFYIMAPGMVVVSDAIGGGVKTMSGTSQAAPQVAGAVAIINQMWPYMTPANQVQLLLKTANKNLPNYDVNVMGQGLLDLNAATRPVGALGISTTGRTGTAVPISGAIALSNTSTQTVSKLSSISAVDSFQRDFTVNLSPMVVKNTLMSNAVTMDADPGFNWSGRWTGLVAGQNQHALLSGAQTSTGDSTVTIDSRMFDPLAQRSHQLTLTNSKFNPFVNFSGSWGQTNGSTTMEYSTLQHFDTGWWGQVGAMQTVVHYAPGMVSKLTPVTALHAVGGKQIGNLNLFAGIKPTVVHGYVNLLAPTSVDDNGIMTYTQIKNNLAGSAPVAYAGFKWQHSINRDGKLTLRGQLAQDGSSNAKLYYTHQL